LGKAVESSMRGNSQRVAGGNFIRKFEEIVSRDYGGVLIFYRIASSVANPGC
jgi:hypothetical protein